jgi:hypothetical protein
MSYPMINLHFFLTLDHGRLWVHHFILAFLSEPVRDSGNSEKGCLSCCVFSHPRRRKVPSLVPVHSPCSGLMEDSGHWTDRFIFVWTIVVKNTALEADKKPTTPVSFSPSSNVKRTSFLRPLYAPSLSTWSSTFQELRWVYCHRIHDAAWS